MFLFLLIQEQQEKLCFIIIYKSIIETVIAEMLDHNF